MSKLSIFGAFLTATLLFQGCSNNENSSKSQTTPHTTKASLSSSTFRLKGIDAKEYIVTKKGEGFTLKNKKNTLVIFDIFATWCPPCQAEASHLSSLQKKYPTQLKVIGVTVEENIPNSNLTLFQKEHTANYTLVNSPENRKLINAIAKELKIGQNFGIPLMVLYKDGKLINYYQGATEEEFIESDIKKALGKK